jgi:glutamine synthetase
MSSTLTAHEPTRPLTGELAEAIGHGQVTDVEVAWPDHSGHVLGKRIPAGRFADRAAGAGFPFCGAALAWNTVGDVEPDARISSARTGFPDLFAIPDLTTARPLPWRPGAWQVLADVVDHHRDPAATSPRAVLQGVIGRLGSLGYTARIGVELECYLLRPDGTLLQDGVQAYSLEKSNDLDPLLSAIASLEAYVPVEGILTEYGPGQVEVNLAHADALTAADDAFRLRYAIKELARRHGLLATFMAKPFAGLSGSSSHVHVSLWQQGSPAFAPAGGGESPLARHAVGGLLGHLPAVTLFGSPTVNSYKRFVPDAFAPVTATWGGDNRTAAVRSLLETPESSRIELRTGSADANPYWLVAAILAAIVSGLESGAEPAERGHGDLSGHTEPLPATLADALAAARQDKILADILEPGAVHDFAVLAESEWREYTRQVTSWETDRYLRRA